MRIELNFIQHALKKNIKLLKYDNYKDVRFCKIPIFVYERNSRLCKKKFLGIQFYISKFQKKFIEEKYWGGIYKKVQNDSSVQTWFLGMHTVNKNGLYECSLLGIPLIKKKDSELKKYIKILNIPLYYRNDFYEIAVKKLDLLMARNSQIDAQFLDLRKRMNSNGKLVYASVSNIQAAQTHPEIFSKYKNCFYGMDVVVCGCGPTIIDYIPIRNAIHIGVNRAFQVTSIKFDFLFAQDNFPEGMREINLYNSDSCHKFYGWLPNERARIVNGVVRRICPADYFEAKADKYIIEDMVKAHWGVDLSIEPFGDFEGTVFSALQFACFTHPKRIFIVGCDCSAGHFHDAVRDINKNIQLDSWRRFKKYIADTYPDIEVISVNPIGLKGMFQDMYTQGYLRKYAKL